ncbi:acyl carrier protein [Catellatospora coxensis]|nr:phosphopantetheine-binding protein [Catellatospora coxensis]
MTEDSVFRVVRTQICEVMDGLRPDDVTLDDRLADLGADSIDRMDVVAGAQRQLGLELEPRRFAGVSDIRSLVATLHAALSEQSRHPGGQAVPR